MPKAARIAFHIYLLLTLFGMTVGVLYFWLMRNDFLTQNPGIEPYYRLYIAAAFLMITGTIALLNDRLWGFWIFLVGLAAAFCIEIMSGFPWEKIIRIPLAALALFLLLRWNKKI